MVVFLAFEGQSPSRPLRSYLYERSQSQEVISKSARRVYLNAGRRIHCHLIIQLTCLVVDYISLQILYEFVYQLHIRQCIYIRLYVSACGPLTLSTESLTCIGHFCAFIMFKVATLMIDRQSSTILESL